MSAGLMGFFLGMIVGGGFGIMTMGAFTISSMESRCEECRDGRPYTEK